MNSSKISPYTSLSLKLVGVILTISSLLDYIVLAIPFEPMNREWQVGFTSQIVDRGIIPMVGMAFLLLGYWIDNNSASGNPSRGARAIDLRQPMFIFATILGLLFLLLVPLHANNIRLLSSDKLQEISEGAGVIENRLEAQSGPLLDQQIQVIEEAIKTGQLQGRQLNEQQLEQLEQRKQQLLSLRSNPDALQAQLDERKNQLGAERLKLEQKAKTEGIKQGLRIGLSSLMLAVGYSVIGWLGLKGGSGSGASRPKRP